eukprot:scaffold18973_cov66-Phaeocystis_antarctica.AAC.5
MAERCRGWDGDAAWHGTVPLGLYAQAVHGVCGFVLSEDELCQLLCAVHPEQGEPPSGKLPCGNQPPRGFGQFARSSSGRPPASGSLRQPRPASANWQMCSGWQATPALFSTQSNRQGQRGAIGLGLHPPLVRGASARVKPLSENWPAAKSSDTAKVWCKLKKKSKHATWFAAPYMVYYKARRRVLVVHVYSGRPDSRDTATAGTGAYTLYRLKR